MASIELGRLLAELKKTASPVQRLKLAARAWRSLRRLAPGERRELAAHVGLEGAEDLLERLVSRGGSRLPPSLLLRALDRVRGTEPGEVTRVLDTLKDPERREELLRRGVEALTSEPEVDTPSLPPAEPEVETAQPVEPTPVEVAPPEPKTPPVVPVVAPPPPVVAEEPPAAPEPPALAEEPPPEPPAPPFDDDERVDRIAVATSVTERFRRLRRGLDGVRDLSADQLGRLLDRFPAGWQRRRLLAALLREGIPDSLEQALSLIELLESPRSRRWCASIVLERWPLTADERGELIERHGLFRSRI